MDTLGAQCRGQALHRRPQGGDLRAEGGVGGRGGGPVEVEGLDAVALGGRGDGEAGLGEGGEGAGEGGEARRPAVGAAVAAGAGREPRGRDARLLLGLDGDPPLRTGGSFGEQGRGRVGRAGWGTQ